MANVDDLRTLRYDCGAITRGRHARRLRYKTMSGRMDLILYVLSCQVSPLEGIGAETICFCDISSIY